MSGYKNHRPVAETNDFSELIEQIKKYIEETKSNIMQAVNSQMVLMYWNIGKAIKSNIIKNKRADYGAQLIENLSKQLSFAFGKGYSKANLTRMIKFSGIFQDSSIVATLSQQLSWSHFIELLKIEDTMKREFYITMCINEKWSVRSFKERISSMLYERTAISKLPERTIKNDIELLKNDHKMTPQLFFRDPYILDFLELRDTYSEKDLENAILKELENFILEMGVDFAFLSRQKRITIDNEDYYIDLLFYHRKMKRLVVIELKLDKFKPEHKGQVELYLRWLNKHERIEGENSPLALVLCAEKSSEIVELMELDNTGIHVAQYLTELPPKDILEKKLHDAINRARLMLEQREDK